MASAEVFTLEGEESECRDTDHAQSLGSSTVPALSASWNASIGTTSSNPLDLAGEDGIDGSALPCHTGTMAHKNGAVCVSARSGEVTSLHGGAGFTRDGTLGQSPPLGDPLNGTGDFIETRHAVRSVNRANIQTCCAQDGNATSSHGDNKAGLVPPRAQNCAGSGPQVNALDVYEHGMRSSADERGADTAGTTVEYNVTSPGSDAALERRFADSDKSLVVVATGGPTDDCRRSLRDTPKQDATNPCSIDENEPSTGIECIVDSKLSNISTGGSAEQTRYVSSQDPAGITLHMSSAPAMEHTSIISDRQQNALEAALGQVATAGSASNVQELHETTEAYPDIRDAGSQSVIGDDKNEVVIEGVIPPNRTDDVVDILPLGFVRCPGCPVAYELVPNEDAARGGGGGIPLQDIPKGANLSRRAAMRHGARHRFRCPACEAAFCGLCRACPYHAGFDCEGWVKYQAKPKCVYCGDAAEMEEDHRAADADDGNRSSTSPCCSSPECRERANEGCKKKIECGHPCRGTGGDECIPCMEPGCPSAAVDGDAEYCNICWTESLLAAPCIQLNCGHFIHASCGREQLERGRPTARLTFGFMSCPVCRADKVLATHASMITREGIKKQLELAAEVEELALQRLRADELPPLKKSSMYSLQSMMRRLARHRVVQGQREGWRRRAGVRLPFGVYPLGVAQQMSPPRAGLGLPSHPRQYPYMDDVLPGKHRQHPSFQNPNLDQWSVPPGARPPRAWLPLGSSPGRSNEKGLRYLEDGSNVVSENAVRSRIVDSSSKAKAGRLAPDPCGPNEVRERAREIRRARLAEFARQHRDKRERDEGSHEPNMGRKLLRRVPRPPQPAINIDATRDRRENSAVHIDIEQVDAPQGEESASRGTACVEAASMDVDRQDKLGEHVGPVKLLRPCEWDRLLQSKVERGNDARNRSRRASKRRIVEEVHDAADDSPASEGEKLSTSRLWNWGTRALCKGREEGAIMDMVSKSRRKVWGRRKPDADIEKPRRINDEAGDKVFAAEGMVNNVLVEVNRLQADAAWKLPRDAAPVDGSNTLREKEQKEGGGGTLYGVADNGSISAVASSNDNRDEKVPSDEAALSRAERGKDDEIEVQLEASRDGSPVSQDTSGAERRSEQEPKSKVAAEVDGQGDTIDGDAMIVAALIAADTVGDIDSRQVHDRSLEEQTNVATPKLKQQRLLDPFGSVHGQSMPRFLPSDCNASHDNDVGGHCLDVMWSSVLPNGGAIDVTGPGDAGQDSSDRISAEADAVHVENDGVRQDPQPVACTPELGESGAKGILKESVDSATFPLESTKEVLHEANASMDGPHVGARADSGDGVNRKRKLSMDEAEEQRKEMVKRALKKYSYYQCHSCVKPYFGGLVSCEPAASGGGADSNNSSGFAAEAAAAERALADVKPEELLCGKCSASSGGADCSEHGQEFMEHKCYWCCAKVSSYFCGGVMHFCDVCHLHGFSSRPKPCLGGSRCLFGGVHPPNAENGKHEFALGCGICRPKPGDDLS